MRETCVRKIPGGTCAELQGHKSMCRTAKQIEQYEAQMRQVEAEQRAARRRRLDEMMEG